MFLTDNACHSSATLAGKCRVYATDGGCRVCNAGFYRHEKTCLECDPKCRTCTSGDSCTSCASTHFMGVDGVCLDKSEIVGCAVDISSEHGCDECVPGYFPQDRMCSLCNATFEHCAVCDGEACTACVPDHVLTGGSCTHLANITHCTAADRSKCTMCSFWHAPTPDGTGCAARAVWWVIVLAVVAALVVVCGLVACVACLVNVALRAKHRRDVARTVCVFAMGRSNVEFVPTKVANVVTSTRCVVFDGAIPVDAESKALLCIGNVGKRRVRVQVVGKDTTDKYTVRVVPGGVLLEKGMACEFEVFVTPLCSCTVDDRVAVVVRESGSAETGSVTVDVKAETEITSRLHYDDVVCETQIGEGSFSIVFKGGSKAMPLPSRI